MASNVYTKNEILQNLASKGFFVDAYTLDTFFEKWKVEAIFEDEQGSEFYDRNALELVMENLFNSPDEKATQEQEEPRMLKEPEMLQTPAQQVTQPIMQQEQVQPQFNQQMPQGQFQQEMPSMQQYQQQMPQMQQYQQPVQQMPYQQYPQTMQQQYQAQVQYPQYQQYNQQMPQQPYPQPMQQQVNQYDMGFNDVDTNNILNNISLSDGSSLMSKVQDTSVDAFVDYEQLRKEAVAELGLSEEPQIESIFAKDDKKIGILEGAMQAASDELASELGASGIISEIMPDDIEPQVTEAQTTVERVDAQVVSPASNVELSEFDDMNLLNESLEAQERFREYVVSELSKKNLDLTPKDNEFKLDISERTINMVARSMAKKIASHVSKIFAQNNGNSAELAKVKKENEKLEQRTRDLEDQIKKLRLLLAESNKNLNSYKPSIFGLYKKVPPGQ